MSDTSDDDQGLRYSRRGLRRMKDREKAIRIRAEIIAAHHYEKCELVLRTGNCICNCPMWYRLQISMGVVTPIPPEQGD